MDNSAITEITGFDLDRINKDRLYKSALRLNTIQKQLGHHLSIRTNELFDIQDKIVLYDLTKSMATPAYFEGEKRNSTLAEVRRKGLIVDWWYWHWW